MAAHVHTYVYISVCIIICEGASFFPKKECTIFVGCQVNKEVIRLIFDTTRFLNDSPLLFEESLKRLFSFTS